MIENDKSADGSLRPAHEGEGLDRNNLDLPGRQADLVRALARRAPGLPVIVVLFNGGGLDVGWIDRMPAVSSLLAVGFPGQVGAVKQLVRRYLTSAGLEVGTYLMQAMLHVFAQAAVLTMFA
jgi:hypothetical protein